MHMSALLPHILNSHRFVESTTPPQSESTSTSSLMSGHSKRRRFELLIVLILVAASTRLLPLAISSFPFNNDGMTESRIAADILDAGHLDYSEDAYYYGSHSTITPAYNVLLAFAASFLGVSTFSVAQYVVGAFSLTTVVGAYVISLRVTSSPPAAFMSALVLALFGTFVFLTGSSWKESLGVAVLILLVYLYIGRDQPRMLMLMAATLCVLPLIHHFVAALAYLSMWFLAIWSLIFAARRGSLKKRHVRDLGVITLTTVLVYGYYASNSLDRLSTFGEPRVFLFGIVFFFLMIAVTYWYLTKESRLSASFAPIPASAISIIFLLDYFNPFFGYEQGSPPAVFVAVFSLSVIVGLGWYGLEILIEFNNRYRAVPLGLLMPVIFVMVYAVTMESNLWSHWMIYRSYDFVVIPLALGIGASAKTLLSRPWRRKWLMVGLLCVLVLSFPFSYWTGPLTGVRHDTQCYEYDAITWAHTNFGGERAIRSDERLAYDAEALYDIIKDPYLPRTLNELQIPDPGEVNLLLEEWCVVGVNDYPMGHPILDESHVQDVMDDSDVLYVGGPADNNIIGFVT